MSRGSRFDVHHSSSFLDLKQRLVFSLDGVVRGCWYIPAS